MAMLSKLRRFELCGEGAARAKLVDLAIAMEADYPPITHLLFRNEKGEQVSLPWKAVRQIDWRRGRIDIAGLSEGKVATENSLKKKVLLRRDVIDALVIDLHNRRATRANDLWLEEADGELLLKAVDTTARAVLRRLSRGRFGAKPSRAPYDWKYIEFLRGDPRAVSNGAGYRMRIGRLPPGEIAGLSRALPYLHAAELITLLPDPIAADTLEAMPPERRLQIFGELDDQQALSLLGVMAPDDATDLLGRLPPESARKFLEKLPEVRREKLIELLRYPEDTVGGIMTNDVVTVALDQTVREAREVLRDRLKEPDFTHFIYVVESDETRVLRGSTSLRDFVRAKDEERVETLMNPYIATLDPLEPARAGSYRVINAQMAALPVIGSRGRLLGIVTVDAAVMRVAPATWSAQAPRVFS
jgi:magnesium transporter